VFSISRAEKFGGDIHFKSYEDIEAAYAIEELHPGDLKVGVTDALVAMLKPIQEMFEKDEEWKEAERLGYPSAATAAIVASAKQGAGNKAEGKVGYPSWYLVTTDTRCRSSQLKANERRRQVRRNERHYEQPRRKKS
jgi:hypothetical protein